MSDLLIGNIKAPTNGANSTALADALTTTGLPKTDGKSESSSGNSLPLLSGTEEQDSRSIALILNNMALNVGRDLKFIVDLDSAQPIIQVFNSETGELIRQIPSARVSTYSLNDGAEALRLVDSFA